ncbi:F-box protein At3g07870-like [Quercus lobata]|uniref:F-box protein At3g07870-like n=1 Tax=Quercus lobata TaxID=97700 RepID=UPI001248BB09|nr:F-box protein At3g07870-like [Quercus lobata]
MSSATLNDLPEDVLMDIYSRLPIKTILQFKSVCKSWYDIIKDPIFITKHVNLSNRSNNGYLAVTRRVGTFGGKCLISLFSYETFREVFNITIPFKKEHGRVPFRIVGSCNGILCLNISKIGDTNFLFNPVTSEFKEPPKPDYPVHKLSEIEILLHIGLGFDYDQETNDYKLVRVSYSKKMKESFYSGVNVYSLRTNYWRRKDTLVHGSIVENSFSNGDLNGALHWRGAIRKKEIIHNIIISFNIRDEVSRQQYEPRFDIWVMNEYGVKETWTKQFSIGPLLAWSFVGCGRNEELLFATSSTILYLYDLQLQQIKPPHDNTYADVMGSNLNFVAEIEVVNHIESLVTIEGTKVCVKRERKKSRFRENFISIISVVFIYFVAILAVYIKTN